MKTRLVNGYVGVAPGTMTVLGALDAVDDVTRGQLLQAVEVLEAFRSAIQPWLDQYPAGGFLDVAGCAILNDPASGIVTTGCPATDITVPEANQSSAAAADGVAVAVWWPTAELVNINHAWTFCHDQLAVIDPSFQWPMNTAGHVDISSLLGSAAAQLDLVIPEVRKFTGASSSIWTYVLIGVGVLAAGGLIWALARRGRHGQKGRAVPAMAGAKPALGDEDPALRKSINHVRETLNEVTESFEEQIGDLETWVGRLEDRIGKLEDHEPWR
jgi:hypothetical protein